MAGNVWEVCSDWFDPDHYARCDAERPTLNPSGPETWRIPWTRWSLKRVMGRVFPLQRQLLLELPGDGQNGPWSIHRDESRGIQVCIGYTGFKVNLWLCDL